MSAGDGGRLVRVLMIFHWLIKNFAEHRHKVGLDGLTQEIVLVSQAQSQIAKYLRDLIDSTVLSIKIMR
ncbi:hypothetical protein CCP3SC1AL1_1590006 [Gammaproteobacteria bacterium]